MKEWELRCILWSILRLFESGSSLLLCWILSLYMYRHKSYCMSYSSYLVQVSLLGIVYAHTLQLQVLDQERRLHSHHHYFQTHFWGNTDDRVDTSSFIFCTFWKEKILQLCKVPDIHYFGMVVIQFY